MPRCGSGLLAANSDLEFAVRTAPTTEGRSHGEGRGLEPCYALRASAAVAGSTPTSFSFSSRTQVANSSMIPSGSVK